MLWPEGLLQPGSAFGCWYVFLVLFAVCPHCHHLSHPFEISCLKGGPLRQTFPQGLFWCPQRLGLHFFQGSLKGSLKGSLTVGTHRHQLQDSIRSRLSWTSWSWQCFRCRLGCMAVPPRDQRMMGFESMHWWPSTSTVAKQKTVTVSCFSLVFSHGNFRFIRGSHKGK